MVTNLYKVFVYLGDKTSNSNVEYTNNTTNEQGKKYVSMNFRMLLTFKECITMM